MMDITSIRYINLDKNWHRRILLKWLLWKTPYKVFRCPGVKYDETNRSYDKYLKFGLDVNVDMRRASGVIGCWIAHSHALEHVLDKQGITVVLEDDFVCKPHFFRNALKKVNEFNRDFDIIIFDAWGNGPLPEHKIAEDIYQPGTCSYPYYAGTQCLFVNNASIPKILNAKLNSQPMDYDGFLLAGGKVNTYIFYTKQSTIRLIGSDIHPDYKINYGILGVLISLVQYACRIGSIRVKMIFHKLIGEAL